MWGLLLWSMIWLRTKVFGWGFMCVHCPCEDSGVNSQRRLVEREKMPSSSNACWKLKGSDFRGTLSMVFWLRHAKSHKDLQLSATITIHERFWLCVFYLFVSSISIEEKGTSMFVLHWHAMSIHCKTNIDAFFFLFSFLVHVRVFMGARGSLVPFFHGWTVTPISPRAFDTCAIFYVHLWTLNCWVWLHCLSNPNLDIPKDSFHSSQGGQ